MSEYKRKSYSEQDKKPKCEKCGIACRVLNERQKLSLVTGKSRPRINVEFIRNGNDSTILYICPTKTCRRIYTKDNILVSDYWV